MNNSLKQKAKRIFIGIIALSFTANVTAQEAADRKVQAGLVAGFGINFQKMETKKLVTDGVGADFTVGTNVNYTFNETIGLTVGIEFDFGTLKYKAGANPVYYFYNDNTILTQEQADTDPNRELFQMVSRKQKTTYLSIPTMALFRTKFIGYFRYFGKFGLRSSFLLSNKIFDDGYNYTNTFGDNPLLETATEGTNENMSRSKNDMIFFKSAVGLAGGAEWNFIGSTSLVAEIGYYYGFVSLYWNKEAKDRSLFEDNGTLLASDRNFFNNAAKQSQLRFKISILF